MATKNVSQDDLNRILDDYDGGPELTQEDLFHNYLVEDLTADAPSIPDGEREAYRKFLKEWNDSSY